MNDFKNFKVGDLVTITKTPHRWIDTDIVFKIEGIITVDVKTIHLKAIFNEVAYQRLLKNPPPGWGKDTCKFALTSYMFPIYEDSRDFTIEYYIKTCYPDE